MFHDGEGDSCGSVISDRVTCSGNVIIIRTSFLITYFDIAGIFVSY